MNSHRDIDRRSLALARAVASMIDADPDRLGLLKARANCARWLQSGGQACVREWADILQADWGRVRTILLDESEQGCRLRQSSPFCGVLTPAQRWAIYREVGRDQRAA